MKVLKLQQHPPPGGLPAPEIRLPGAEVSQGRLVARSVGRQ